MTALAIVLLSGLLILDVVLELWRDGWGIERRRQLERDQAEMRRALHRHPRP